MRRLSIALACACWLFTGAARATFGDERALQDIQTLWDGMQAAANAHDTERFLAPFRHDENLVFAIDGKLIRGWDALHAQQLIWWQNGKASGVYTQEGQTEFLTLAPDAVVSTARLTSRRKQADGQLTASMFVVTLVWKKSADNWQVVYGHESWGR
jgi:ketosteroid isomerase-like protein